MAQILNNLARGMVRNTNHLKKDPQYYNFALNISTDKNQIDRLTRVTESKLDPYYSLKGVDYVILNALYLNLDEYVFFITDKLGSYSEIIYYNKGTLITKYNNIDLNFNPAYIISSTYRVNYNGDRLIYFVDGYNKDRVINLDKINLSDNIESISINPIYDYSSNLNYTINYLGGSLPSGKYYIFVEPIDLNGKSAQYKYLVDGIPIENGNYKEELSKSTISTIEQFNNFVSESQDFNEVHGLVENSITSKSITINLSDLNENFKTVNIYVVIKNDTTYETYLLENRTLIDSITISNLSEFVTLGSDISTILVSNVIYNKSETIVQKDNRLILANTQLETYNYDFQQIANKITVRPLLKKEVFNTTKREDNKWFQGIGSNIQYNSNSGSLNATDNEKNIFSTPYYLAKTQKVTLEAKTFMRDEVYALGVYFELENGVFTDVYHIPGRKANDIPTSLLNSNLLDETGRVLNSATATNWDTQTTTLEGTTAEYWKLYNTGVQGMLGYYRCDNVYPDGYGFPTDGEKNSQGKSYIRHHRIPSEYVYNTLDAKDFPQNNEQVLIKNIINLEFNNIQIPEDLQSIIKRVHFCIADRNENNKKVLSKGILYVNRVLSDGTIRNSEMLNAPLRYQNDIRSRVSFEFKSPEVDFLFKNSNIKGSYLKPTNVLVGYVNHFAKGLIIPTTINIPIPGSFINYEGINRSTTEQNNIIYDYKQEIVLNRVNYRNFISSRVSNESVKQYKLADIIFIDNNSVTSFSGDTVRYEGNQNSTVLKLANSHMPTPNNLITDGDLMNKIPQEYKNIENGSSYLFRSFYFEDQRDRSDLWPKDQINVVNKKYFDSTLYATLLSDNTNIFSDLLNLRYSKVIDNNRVIQGDSFIENHFTKKSYSTAISDRNYSAAESFYNAKDKVAIIRLSTTDGELRTAINLDMSASESYISFPVETRLNIRLRRHDGDNNHFPYNTITSVFPVNELEKKVLTQEVYELDSKYYNENSINPLFPNMVKVEDLSSLSKKIGQRIIYSQLQNNESNIDNFRNFLPNNYRDIITTKGNIYKLFIKDNNLYILTRDSLFQINSSNNYLTTREGGDIYVGTGEFLGTEPEEIISLETGYAGTRSKLSFNESKFGYLFVDDIRNKIILFNKNLTDLNAIGLNEDLSINLYKYFPQLDTGLDKPLLGYGILSGFDPESDRLFITKLDYKPTQLLLDGISNNSIVIKDGLFYNGTKLVDFSNVDYFENKSFTVTLDGLTNTWISYHDYFPDYYIPNPQIFTPNIKNSVTKFGKDFADRSIIDITMNENFNVVKVFDSLKFDVRSEDSFGDINNDFFSSIILYNDHQSTGLINLDSVPFSNNLTKKESYWNYNYMLDNSRELANKRIFSKDWSLLKDQYFIDKVIDPNQIDFNKPWNKKHRLRDKYLNIRLIKNNTNNNKLVINFVIANVRQSIR